MGAGWWICPATATPKRPRPSWAAGVRWHRATSPTAEPLRGVLHPHRRRDRPDQPRPARPVEWLDSLDLPRDLRGHQGRQGAALPPGRPQRPNSQPSSAPTGAPSTGPAPQRAPASPSCACWWPPCWRHSAKDRAANWQHNARHPCNTLPNPRTAAIPHPELAAQCTPSVQNAAKIPQRPTGPAAGSARRRRPGRRLRQGRPWPWGSPSTVMAVSRPPRGAQQHRLVEVAEGGRYGRARPSISVIIPRADADPEAVPGHRNQRARSGDVTGAHAGDGGGAVLGAAAMLISQGASGRPSVHPRAWTAAAQRRWRAIEASIPPLSASMSRGSPQGEHVLYRRGAAEALVDVALLEAGLPRQMEPRGGRRPRCVPEPASLSAQNDSPGGIIRPFLGGRPPPPRRSPSRAFRSGSMPSEHTPSTTNSAGMAGRVDGGPHRGQIGDRPGGGLGVDDAHAADAVAGVGSQDVSDLGRIGRTAHVLLGRHDLVAEVAGHHRPAVARTARNRE